MFWKKGQTPPSSKQTVGSTRSPASPSPPPEVEILPKEPPADDLGVQAIETLAEVLRALGRHAFDLDEVPKEETSQAFEKWAMRLLVGDAADSREEGAPSERRRGIQRDWGGVRRFVDKHRKGEHDYVVTGMENLRQAVRVFIQCTTGGFRAEHASDAIVSGELDALGRALAINDHAQIRDAAERTASTVRREMDERRNREQKQIDALHESMEKLRHELSQVRREARTDGLTRVYNRAALDEHILQVADQSFLSNTEACVVMVDIDFFKGINDNYGHQTGDEVLRQVADTIVRDFFRREDFVARYGGEEFCIVAQHTSFEVTRERAERLRQSVEKLAIHAFGKTLHVSVSFGIAALQRGETAPSWLKRADDALYRAKQKGRNRISIAPPGEALGGGPPLGAHLSSTSSVRPPESPRIVVASAKEPLGVHDSSAPPSSARLRDATPAKRVAASGRAPTQTAERPNKASIPRQSPANTNAQHEPPPPKPRGSGPKRTREPGANSPIAALLGPGSRR